MLRLVHRFDPPYLHSKLHVFLNGKPFTESYAFTPFVFKGLIIVTRQILRLTKSHCPKPVVCAYMYVNIMLLLMWSFSFWDSFKLSFILRQFFLCWCIPVFDHLSYCYLTCLWFSFCNFSFVTNNAECFNSKWIMCFRWLKRRK